MAVRKLDHVFSRSRDVRPCPLPATPGLALLATPASILPATIAALGTKGASTTAITTAWFGEDGAECGRAVKAAQIVWLRL